MVEISSVRKRLDYTGMLTCTVVTKNPSREVVKTSRLKIQTLRLHSQKLTVREKLRTEQR